MLGKRYRFPKAKIVLFSRLPSTVQTPISSGTEFKWHSPIQPFLRNRFQHFVNPTHRILSLTGKFHPSEMKLPQVSVLSEHNSNSQKALLQVLF